MGDLIFVLVLSLSLGIGLAAVLVAHRLRKRYRLGHLSSYLYFQVFINAFGVYGILGRVIAREVLGRRGASFETIETIGHFFTFLGLPFLVLAWYMFLRLTREMVDAGLSRKATMAYFSALGAAFLAYGLVLVWANVSTWSRDRFVAFSSGFTLLYAGLVAGTLVSGLSGLLRRVPSGGGEAGRKAVRVFAAIFFLANGAALVLSPYAQQPGWRAAAYVAGFFCANLVPLLYWRSRLADRVPAAPPAAAAADAMARFIEIYKISRREEEVIRELCAGKTNKEIAQALFISLQTVKDHIYRIYLKTNVGNRVQLLNLVRGRGGQDEERGTG